MPHFRLWIMRFGRGRLAREVGVTWWAVNKWALGSSTPSKTIAWRIVDASRGAITLEDIYGRED